MDVDVDVDVGVDVDVDVRSTVVDIIEGEFCL